ncbi:MAG TPA: CPBP family intramembrane glutamic endopeptidase, partial [Solirubrobacteraceae bacterium]|nr:CPBP family intramembrane glutamic endopeptidase [Solirubrobacteraceae bacterium]
FGSPVGHPTPAVTITADYFFDFAFVAAALWFAVLQAGMRPADFGYRRISWKLGAFAFAIAAVGYYVFTTLYSDLLSLHGTDRLPNELGTSRSTAAAIAAAVFVCVVAPMAEEFFFRGFLFGVLRRMDIRVAGRQLGPWLAAIIVGLLFGLAHTGSAASQYLVPLGFLGFVLCLLRWRTRSLYPCMALHSLNNCLALGVNQLSWGAGLIVALTVGSLALIAALTWPLSRAPQRSAAAGAPG